MQPASEFPKAQRLATQALCGWSELPAGGVCSEMLQNEGLYASAYLSASDFSNAARMSLDMPGGKISYTTSGGTACEEWWPSVLIIDPFKEVITELVTVHVDC